MKKYIFLILIICTSLFFGCTDKQRQYPKTSSITETTEEKENELPKVQKENEFTKEKTQKIPESKPIIEDEKKEEVSTCTLSVRCNSILDNMSKLKSEKKDIIPSDGIILKEQSVIFNDGESVFDVLLRVMKDNKIHLEYESSPPLNNAYIEGIANIYEFDCGNMSGWLYTVNGKKPDCGCSDYVLKNGDKVEWIYSCDFSSSELF